jgi:hypothetical protein
MNRCTQHLHPLLMMVVAVILVAVAVMAAGVGIK